MLETTTATLIAPKALSVIDSKTETGDKIGHSNKGGSCDVTFCNIHRNLPWLCTLSISKLQIKTVKMRYSRNLLYLITNRTDRRLLIFIQKFIHFLKTPSGRKEKQKMTSSVYFHSSVKYASVHCNATHLCSLWKRQSLFRSSITSLTNWALPENNKSL